ncbi:MAG: FAD-binding oxidoreductase [Pseudolabrys sp.]|nr:FAD-binding oxidoreductase [Pseudolabrys sp.]MBV9262019.1 FAD-binding oxidoreductase [Pseudolabrys sp.]
MARTDAMVLGAGIVGTSIALHLAKRGMSVALVDKRGPGEETSYGNAGVLEGNTLLPHPFPAGIAAFLEVVLGQTAAVNYHIGDLPHTLPWILDYRRNSTFENRKKFAAAMRPLFARAVPEHEALMQEANATRYLRKEGWIKVYRNAQDFDDIQHELDLAREYGLDFRTLDTDETRALEPSLEPVFKRAIHWPGAATVSNPLAVTRAYAARFSALGGVVVTGDALSLHRNGKTWRVDTHEGALDAEVAVVALGPWAPDLLKRFDIDLPLGIKRGYHRHFKPQGNKTLTRAVVDTENGYCMAPMEQGLRITTGAEFADRDAAPTPVQFDRLLPKANELLPLGPQVDEPTWLGRRPCFADSRPVIDRAPGQDGLWLAFGHAHWGLTLGPATGRLLGEMMTGATPFCDPKPYSALRFN